MRKTVNFHTGETSVVIVADEKYIKTAEDAIFEARGIIIGKIEEDGFFKDTLEPYPSQKNDHEIIRMMCDASVLAGVGPMAGVAGAVAYHAVKKMKDEGAKYAVVENGGDIALFIDENTTVALYTGNSKLEGIGLSVEKRDGIFGICSSSAKIGPSISLGGSDVCTVISGNVVLADACATALGNLVDAPDPEKMSESVEKIGKIEGIDGCLALCGEYFASYGNVPELVGCKYDKNKNSPKF